MTSQPTPTHRATTEDLTTALVALMVRRANPAECVRIARAHMEALQAIVTQADGYNAPVSEAAGMVLADLGIVEMLLDERKRAIREAVKQEQGVAA